MAIYCVAMEQAVSVTDLAGNGLCTGTGDRANRLQGCAAVILFNQATRAAALYHYPAGDITHKPNARQLLGQLSTTIDPTHCYVAYGVKDVDAWEDRSTIPADTFHAALCQHLRPLLPGHTSFSTLPAQAGVVTLTQSGGVPHLDFYDPTVRETDLTKHLPGVYPNFVIYHAHD